MNYRDHRQQLLDSVNHGLVVASAYDAVQLSGDMAAPFLQEANFFWLTGIELPGWKVIIDGRRTHTTLVRPLRTSVEEIFDGSTDEDTLVRLVGADEVIGSKEFEQRLRRLSDKHALVYTPHAPRPHPFILNPAPAELHAQLERIFPKVEDCTKQLAALRAIKSPEEIAAIRRAVKLTTKTFADIHAQLASYRGEYEIEAHMTLGFRMANARHAYEPIVASGEHAITLHYTDNAGRLSKNKMVLIDVGARVDGYAADITRTYCVNPTKRQRAVHAAVERAHRQIIALLCPELLVSEYIARVDDIMKGALQEIGLLDDKSDDETYRRYFPHAVSHGLGIDVHDSLGAPRYFKPGMVLTVEPGIYIPEEGIGTYRG